MIELAILGRPSFGAGGAHWEASIAFAEPCTRANRESCDSSQESPEIPQREAQNESKRNKVESRKIDSESPSESHPISLWRKRGDEKEDRSLFSVSVTIWQPFVTFLTFLVTFLPIPFCLPPFAAGWLSMLKATLESHASWFRITDSVPLRSWDPWPCSWTVLKREGGGQNRTKEQRKICAPLTKWRTSFLSCQNPVPFCSRKFPLIFLKFPSNLLKVPWNSLKFPLPRFFLIT